MISAADTRREAIDTVDRYVNSEPTSRQALERTAVPLHDRFDRRSWVCLYLVEGNELVLASGDAPEATEHDRIQIGRGICGAAAASGRAEAVEADTRSIACFPSTCCEIAVPTRAPIRGGAGTARLPGEIDVASDEPAASDDGDRSFLEHVAWMVSTRL